MKQLKKIGAIGGGTLLIACWPLAVGQIAQRIFTDNVALLNSDVLAAEVISYDRSYLSAVATTKYTIEDLSLKEQFINDGLPTEFVLEHHIKHQVAKISAKSHFVDLDFIPAQLMTETQLNGNTEFVLEMGSITYTAPDSVASSFHIADSKVQGKVTVLGEMDVAFTFPAIQFHFENNESISISSVTGYSKGKKINGIMYGEQEIRVADVTVGSLENMESYSNVKDFSYQFDSLRDRNAERLDTNHLVKASQVVSGESEFNDFNIDFTLGQIDIDTFESLITLYQNTSDFDDPAAEFDLLIGKLVNKGFQVFLNNLKFAIGDGYFETKLLLELPEDRINLIKGFNQIVLALTGGLDMFISEEIVVDNPHIREGIDELIVMEMMQAVDGGYRIDASFSKGNVVYASGHSTPLASLLMSLSI